MTYGRYAIRQGIQHPIFTLKVMVDWLRLREDVRYVKEKLGQNFPGHTSSVTMGASGGLKEVALYTLIRKYKPNMMIETGVSSCVSTYLILKAMAKNGRGKLTSIDLPNYDPEKGAYIPAGHGPGWLIPFDLARNWKLIIGPTSAVLPTTDVELDAFLHDSDHTYENMTFEYELAFSHVSRPGL